MWVMCSKKLLSGALWTAMTFWPIPVPADGTEVLFELCQNLVTLDSKLDVVRFAHLSVEEYLESAEFTSVAANSMAMGYCLSQFDPAEFIPLEGVGRLHVTRWSHCFSIGTALAYATFYWVTHGNDYLSEPKTREGHV